MENENLIEKLKTFIQRHEKSIHIFHAGDIADKTAQVVNHYEHLAAEAVTKRKQFIEDALVYFRSVIMITETIGMAGTHAEKAARLRGLVELLNSVINKLKDEQTENILSNWEFFSWDYSSYPYKSVLEKFSESKRENEQLKKRIEELETKVA